MPCHPYGFTLSPRIPYVMRPLLPNSIISASAETNGGDIIVSISALLMKYLVLGLDTNT